MTGARTWIPAAAAILLALGFVGCVSSSQRASPTPGDRAVNTEEPKAPEGPAEDRSAASSSQDAASAVREAASALALEIVAKLGYDVEKLEVGRVDRRTLFDRTFWEVTLTDADGDFAEVRTDPAATKVEAVKFDEPFRENRPEELDPGPDLHERVAQRLGLPDEGYRPVTWMITVGRFEYRRYTRMGDWDVALAHVFISLAPKTGELETLRFEEFDPVENPAIYIDGSAATKTALEAMADYPDLVPVHTDLVQMPVPYREGVRPVVCWEVAFSNGAICIVNADGSGYISYHLPEKEEH